MNSGRKRKLYFILSPLIVKTGVFARLGIRKGVRIFFFFIYATAPLFALSYENSITDLLITISTAIKYCISKKRIAYLKSR